MPDEIESYDSSPTNPLLDGFQCPLITLKNVSCFFSPLKLFDGQMLRCKVTDAETKVKRLLFSVERTWQDNAKQGHWHMTCTISRSENHLGVDTKVEQLVMDKIMALLAVFLEGFLRL